MSQETPEVRHIMTSAFVTGGSGFVGQYLIEDLKAKGVKVYALARSERTIMLLEAKGVTVVSGDLGNVETLRKGMELCDTVFHCASTLGVVIDDLERLYQDNVVGSRNVMEAAKKAKSVKRLIYVGSTTAIFDGSDMEYADETTPYPENPVSPYAKTKALAEDEIIKANSNELQTISVRLPVVWGPGDPILPGVVTMAERGYFIYPGGGCCSATQLYVANATSGLVAAAIHGKPGEIYHLSDDRRPTFREIFNGRLASCGCAPWKIGDAIYSRYMPGWILMILVVLCEFLWRSLHLPGAPPLPREGIVIATHHFSVSDKKARSKEHLGWRPPVSHEEGSKREGQWYINNYRKNKKHS